MGAGNAEENRRRISRRTVGAGPITLWRAQACPRLPRNLRASRRANSHKFDRSVVYTLHACEPCAPLPHNGSRGDFGRLKRNNDGELIMTTTTDTLSPAAQRALTTIRNLRTLSKETGTITTKAQNDVLRALNSSDIAAVANALASDQK